MTQHFLNQDGRRDRALGSSGSYGTHRTAWPGSSFLQRTPVRCAAIVLLLALLFGPFSIPLRVLVLAGAALTWTFVEAGNLQPLGMGRHRLRAILLWGVGGAIGIIGLGQVILPFLMKLLQVQIDLSDYGALAGNSAVAVKLLSYALTSAAFGEEVLFRGFLIYQLTAIMGLSKQARWAAITLGGFVFGLAHYPQGIAGIITTGLVGVALGWLWFRSNRNLWALILTHAIVDSFGIALLYLGWSAI